MAKSIGILSRARKFLNKTTLMQLYFSFLYPYLTYCIIIWGRATENALLPIFKTQKRAIRIIDNIRYRDSTKESFHKLKILRLPELYKFTVLLFVYKYKNNLLPGIFDSFYVMNNQMHQYPTRNAGNFRVPITKLRVASTFVKKVGVSLWNEYADQINHDMKIGLFKKAITNILLDTYT